MSDNPQFFIIGIFTLLALVACVTAYSFYKKFKSHTLFAQNESEKNSEKGIFTVVIGLALFVVSSYLVFTRYDHGDAGMLVIGGLALFFFVATSSLYLVMRLPTKP